ncbi:DUF2441 domain-containing protein [Pseudomonas aeruginosa]
MSEGNARGARYFHAAPILLGEGSVIQPGNWGRILKLYRDANAVLYREYVLEQIRASEFPEKPSRFNCVFLLRTYEEAERYRNLCSPLDVIYEVSADTTEGSIHLGDYNFGGVLPSLQLLEGMPELARKYWAEEPADFVEVLFQGPVVVVTRC